jgi:hypothetical protein
MVGAGLPPQMAAARLSGSAPGWLLSARLPMAPPRRP